MSLIDGPTGRELAREELSKRMYADAQPSLPERVVEWLTELLDSWLALANDAPGGRWLLAAAATAFVGSGIWLVIRFGRERPARHAQIFDTPEPHTAAALLASASHHYRAEEWESALVSATRAIVADLQDQALAPTGPGVTITEVAEAVTDPAVQKTLIIFEGVRYGGRECTVAQAQSAIELARRAGSSAAVRR